MVPESDWASRPIVQQYSAHQFEKMTRVSINPWQRSVSARFLSPPSVHIPLHLLTIVACRSLTREVKLLRAQSRDS